jgi:hypothetical protein
VTLPKYWFSAIAEPKNAITNSITLTRQRVEADRVQIAAAAIASLTRLKATASAINAEAGFF